MAKKTLAEKMAENSRSVVEALKTNTIGSFSSTENIKKNIVVFDELKDLIPPLLETEFLALKDNLQKHGCKDPLKVWQTTNQAINISENPDDIVYVLIDGHNRFQLCNELHIPFNIQIDNFESITEVRNFMIDFQLSRRNITPQQASYLRGLRYNTEKKLVTNNLFQNKESDVISPDGQNVHLDNSAISSNENSNEIIEQSSAILPNGQNVHLDNSAKKTTAQELGEYFNVDEKTIRRDADFALGLEKLSPAVRKEILAGQVKVEKSKIQKIGKAKDLNEPINSLDEIEEIYQKLTVEGSNQNISKSSHKNDKLIHERYLKLTDTLNKAYESKSAKEINALKTAFSKFLEALN
jgi:hypothetical protein